MITWIAGEPPARFPSPFAEVPHPLAARAARELAASVGALAEGKMFGVLIVRSEGRLGYLRAFSGMLDGRWLVDGFVPPVFDLAERDAFWIGGEAELAAIDLRLATLDGVLAPLHAERDAMTARHDHAMAELRARHAERRAKRHAQTRTPAHDAESRADGAELRAVKAAIAAEREASAAKLDPLAAERATIEALRAERSRHYLGRIHATYRLANARGEVKSLRDIFGGDPPGGAGDCAAPKLLAYALAHRLEPVALAEIWCGPPPLAGGRRPGAFYPACHGKCGPILAHVLAGIAEPAPVYASAPTALPVIYEDRWLVVVDKPVGVLSVPGRGDAKRDCVQTRLGATVVHRLDLDTSGLLVAAKDDDTYAALQRGFAMREVAKTYAAWLEGDVRGDAGTIELALRVDLDDRPRQIHDPIHGKHAVTTWRVVARDSGRTRVALVPYTGRTHQLRVHAAHPQGLAAPIVGDRLYGTPSERLLLHAESLTFAHPGTGARISFTSPPPF